MVKKKNKENKHGRGDAPAKIARHKYFNTVIVSDDVETFLSSMVLSAEKILKEHDVIMRLWVTVGNIKSHVINAKDTDHYFWWLDHYIDEIGYMIWNGLYDKYHGDCFRTGILIHVPELSKRARNSESVAAYFADMAVDKFVNPYL